MHSYRVFHRFVVALSSLALLAVACTDFQATGSTEVDSNYDALIGTWLATTFVVSDENDQGQGPIDLTRQGPSGRAGLLVTLRFEPDRTGSLEIRDPEYGASMGAEADEFSVIEVTESSLTLAVSGEGIEETLVVEYSRSAQSGSLTLSFSYPLDLDADGKRDAYFVIGTFQKKA